MVTFGFAYQVILMMLFQLHTSYALHGTMQGSAKNTTMLHLSPVPAILSHPPLPQTLRISPPTLGDHDHATADIMAEADKTPSAGKKSAEKKVNIPQSLCHIQC